MVRLTRRHPTSAITCYALVLVTSLTASCVSTQIIELGGGQFIAVQDQKGGIPSETSLISGARDAAAERCGGIARLRVISVDSADTTASSPGNHMSARVHFRCAATASAP